MSAPIVFFDIAGPDSKALRTFYSHLFGWESDGAGQFAVNVDVPLRAAFRQDPGQKRLYIGVNEVTPKLKEIEENGGSIEAPRFEVPGAEERFSAPEALSFVASWASVHCASSQHPLILTQSTP